MRKLLPALLFGLSALLPMPSLAAELDGATELLLRCGAAYVLLADDPQVVSTEQEATNMRSIGEALVTRADDKLSSLGADAEERQRLGERIGTEVAAALAGNTDPGFTNEQCTSLIMQDDPEAAAAINARNSEIDKLMTCGAVFQLVAQVARDDNDADTAAEYANLATALLGRADDLMVESGMGEQSRNQLGQLYGEQVATAIETGEALNYDWDTCAAIEG